MKKINLFTAIAILIAITSVSIQQANARIWRINTLSNYNLTGSVWGDNFGGTANNPVFNSIVTAQSNVTLVQDHDTLYLEGCPPLGYYAGVALTRPFVIIGTGYFLSINTNTSSDLLESRLQNIYFNTGSEGSQLIGVVINSNYGIQINVNDITVKRCYIPAGAAIFVKEFVQNSIINQNYFDNTSGTGSGITFSNYGGPTGLVIRNNIFKRTLIVKNNSGVLTVATCMNNVFDCPPITGNPSVQMMCNNFKNNIVKTAAITLAISGSNTFYNTVATPTQLDTASSTNNKYVSNMSNLFVTPTASTDGNYQLKANASVNYNGSDGAKRGAYGGASVTSRYALSGNAAIPVIYDITTTGVATQATGLPVTIKARTIK